MTCLHHEEFLDNGYEDVDGLVGLGDRTWVGVEMGQVGVEGSNAEAWRDVMSRKIFTC